MKNNHLNFSKSWLTLDGLGYLTLSIAKGPVQWISVFSEKLLSLLNRGKVTSSCIVFLYSTAKGLAKHLKGKLAKHQAPVLVKDLKDTLAKVLPTSITLLNQSVRSMNGLTTNNFYLLNLNISWA